MNSKSAYGRRTRSKELMETSAGKLKILPPGSITPEGWLKDQMLLVNDLQKRLGADPSMSGHGEWTNGEILPRYVRGLCLLAGALGDKQLRDKAESFMSAVFDSAEPGGDFGGRSGGGLAAKIEGVKAALTFYELTGEERALTFLRKFFKNQFNTLSVTPMWYDARARLPEELPAIAAVCRGEQPVWLKELAAKLVGLSCDWQRIADRFPYKRPFDKTLSASAAARVARTVKTAENATGKRREKLFGVARAESEWHRLSHRITVETNGVNIAKAVKYPCIYDEFFGYAGRETLSLRLAGALERYHAGATGMFAADGRLAGTSPVRGIDVESAAEMTESLLEVLAATGESACADLLEEIAYNVLGAAALDDLSSVRDRIETNRAAASADAKNAAYPFGDAYVSGAPSRGAVALLSAYPLFLRSVCLSREGGLDFYSYAPCTVRANVNGAELKIRLDTGYPFRNTIVFRVEEAEGDVSLKLNFRVPRRTSMQLVSGGQIVASGERNISVTCILRTGSTFMLRLNIPLTPALNRDGTVSFYKGSLLMASRPGEELYADRALRGAVCARPTGKWAFAPVLSKRAGGRPVLAGNERTVVGALTDRPFSHASPPFELKILCRNVVGWDYDENGLSSLPKKIRFSEEAAERTFVPFGCTAVGMAQFPPCHKP